MNSLDLQFFPEQLWAGFPEFSPSHKALYRIPRQGCFTSEYFECCGAIQRAIICGILNMGDDLPGRLLPSYLQRFLVLVAEVAASQSLLSGRKRKNSWQFVQPCPCAWRKSRDLS